MDTHSLDLTTPVLVRLPTEIDIVNAGDVRQQLAAASGPGVHLVIADMTATRFCDAAGLRALEAAHQMAAAGGAELRLLMPCPNVVRVMAVLGLDQVLVICGEPDWALAPWLPGRSDDHQARGPGPPVRELADRPAGGRGDVGCLAGLPGGPAAVAGVAPSGMGVLWRTSSS